MKGELPTMKKALALILAAALLFGFAACGKKDADTNADTTAAETTAAEETPSETQAAVPSDESTQATDDATAAVSEGESTTATGETTVPAITAAPTSTEEIVALYNSAVNSAFDAKAGFDKERMTDNEKLDAGVALKAFKSLVYKFMGVGAENKYTESVTKGKWDSDTRRHYLRKSTLTAADVTKATCTANGNQYTIVLNVKGGSSKGSENEKYTNAPIDKCGICVGKEDKGYYDHKTGEVIYDAVAGTYAGAVIEEKYDNAKITAVVDGATGHLVKLTVEFDIAVAIDISVGSGTATARTHIYYKNFKY